MTKSRNIRLYVLAFCLAVMIDVLGELLLQVRVKQLDMWSLAESLITSVLGIVPMAWVVMNLPRVGKEQYYNDINAIRATGEKPVVVAESQLLNRPGL